MPTITGLLRKMSTTFAEPIHYGLTLSDTQWPLNDYLGQSIVLELTGKQWCIQCERPIQKSFQQGYCFVCYRRLLECDLCLLHPERCHVETGSCPVDDWAHAHCHAAHVVYLANSSNLKVGITRASQVPTRWIDQGAIQALPIFQVANRYRAGQVEQIFKAVVDDKTNWRRMLRPDVPSIDLVAARDELLNRLQVPLGSLADTWSESLTPLYAAPLSLQYPVLSYPTRINSLALERLLRIEAQLLGIKGQYLLLDQGVINLRKYGGYELSVTLPD